MSELKAILSQFENTNVYNHYLNIPKEKASPFIDGTNRRIICTFNGKVTVHSSLMPWPGGYFILVNQKLRNQLGISLGDAVHLHLEKDTSEYGMAMPEELEILLGQDESGYRHFHALTPGKQRNLIYIVNSVKNPDSRMNKALAIVDHLKEAMGKLDFKQLNVKIKEYNQRGKLRF